MMLAVGTLLGPYEILRLIGSGGMGEVYLARDSRLERDVAIKVLPDRLAQEPDALVRFQREAKAIAALSHPNTLAIHDLGEDRGIMYSVRERSIGPKKARQPKNDNLRFAHFGISLQIRRRSMRSTFRSHLALEKKLVKFIGSLEGFSTHRPALIRDPRAEQYSYLGEDVAALMKNPAWRHYEFYGHEPSDHVAFIIRKRLAYVNWATEQWDLIRDVKIAIPDHPHVCA